MEHDIERFKKIVDNIFESMESVVEEQKKVPALPALTSGEANDFAKQKALEEMEQVRVAFLEFQDKVRDLMMFNYMTSSFEQFAEYASDMNEVIEDQIDETKLTPETLKKYKSIKKLRAQILSNVYNRYKKKDK